MSDRMKPISFDKMMNWILEEYNSHQSIFGINKIFRHGAGNKKLSLFGELLEAPFGPAAGPHTQLAQNIIAAYAAGGRYFELKTVQTLDGEDLVVAKPCINAADEGYNVEWSTELQVPEAMAEYIKAWFAIKLLSRELGLGDDKGFVFNMSVGYDLEGIKSDKINSFIDGLKDASATSAWNECQRYALANLNKFKNINTQFVHSISPKICNSITLSTLHGCPSAEIERIATYLIQEKHLNTYIKCNPTLLGYDFVRKTMNNMGYDYLVFDSHHFNEDLQLVEAVPMMLRLIELSKANNLEFGVKLTNTFPVGIGANELPGEEMYMSGRSLYPLTISVAKLLSETFEGKLRISYSGGADAHNIEKLFDAGIWPITVATTLLKPGGYERLNQMALMLNNSGDKPFNGVNTYLVSKYANECVNDKYYQKPIKPLPSRRIKKHVPLIDCYTAPCRAGCPIEQDIPAYTRLADEGKYLDALKVITHRNPLPFITGTICPHPCMEKCTRNFYEGAVDVRSVKLIAAQKAFGEFLEKTQKPEISSKNKIAVIGGGPAGLSAAYFLARAGMDVTVFEKRDKLGGVVRYIIPEFRIPNEAIDNDIALVEAMGVKFKMEEEVKYIDELKIKGFTHIIFAVGAWKAGNVKLEKGEAINVLEFLEHYKNGYDNLKLGDNVVVIGGGNSAMDAARAAKHARGVKSVKLVYRRTKKYMPADEDEIALTIKDGIEIWELLAPAAVKWRKITCNKMTLGEPDASGRRSPVDTGMIIEIPADTVIAAVGEDVDKSLFTANGISIDERGHAKLNPKTLETNLKNVYVIGDANLGPSTVVQAIADASKVAKAITSIDENAYDELNISSNFLRAYDKKGLLDAGGLPHKESEKCLECPTVCECCVDVCPNRANIAIKVAGKTMRQVIHVDAMCNECGNCETFCPYNSAPYKDKFTMFLDGDDFGGSKNNGFLLVDKAKQIYRVRLYDKVADYEINNTDCGLEADICKLINAVYTRYEYLF